MSHRYFLPSDSYMTNRTFFVYDYQGLVLNYGCLIPIALTSSCLVLARRLNTRVTGPEGTHNARLYHKVQDN